MTHRIKWILLTPLYFFSVLVAQSTPRVSIITSLYRGASFFEGFLTDITSQTIFKECELIIINANSPERAHEDAIIQKYLDSYPNINYVHLDADPGIYGVWNMAVQMAQAQYITNANVDDRLRYDCYEIHAQALDAHPEIDLVYSDSYITYVPNETFATTNTTKTLNRPAFSKDELKKCCLPNNHPMWRIRMHKNSGYFDETFKVAGDWEMWLRAVKNGSIFLRIDEILGLYYDNPKGLSTDKEGLATKEFWIVWHLYRDL